MSHEIRTPMGIIIGYSELLAAPQVIDTSRLEYATAILRNSRNLLALLNDILDLSKIESGHIQFERKPVALLPFLAELVVQKRIRASGKGLLLDCEFTSSVPETIVSAHNANASIAAPMKAEALAVAPESVLLH